MARKHKAAVPVPFFVCHRPSFDEVMNDCDRPLLEWIESVPVAQRTPPMTRERQRIVTDTHAARDSALAQCEAGRYASRGEDDGEPRLHVAITSRLDGQRGQSSTAAGDSKPSAQVTVSFSSDQACAPVPFEVLHRMAEVGVNFHPERLEVEVRGYFDPPNGIGPFEGSRVVYYGNGANLVAALFKGRPSVSPVFRSRNGWPLFTAWATHEQYPGAPSELLDRCEAYDQTRVQIDLAAGTISHPYMLCRGELRNLTTGASYFGSVVKVDIFESGFVTGDGGLVFEWPAGPSFEWPPGQIFTLFDIHVPLTAPDDLDGEWQVRVHLIDVIVPGGTVRVEYGGQFWTYGVWQRLPLVYAPIPPYAAVGEFSLGRVLSMPASGVGLRVIGADPVPGIGAIVHVQLINSAPVAGCVVVRLSEWGHSVIARNLPAGATSPPVSFLFGKAIGFDVDEDYPVVFENTSGFLAPHGALPDGFLEPGMQVPGPLFFSTDGHVAALNRLYLPGSDEPVTRGSMDIPLRSAPPSPENWDYFVSASCSGLALAGNGEWHPFGPWTFSVTLYSSDVRRFVGDTVSVNLADARFYDNNLVAFGSWSGGDVGTLAEAALRERFEQLSDKYRDVTIHEVLGYRPLRFFWYGLVYDSRGVPREHTSGPDGSIVVDLTTSLE